MYRNANTPVEIRRPFFGGPFHGGPFFGGPFHGGPY